MILILNLNVARGFNSLCVSIGDQVFLYTCYCQEVQMCDRHAFIN